MKYIYPFALLFFLTVISTGCGGDDVDCTDPNLDQNWATEFQAVIDAGAAYGLDQSSDNCKTYKNSLKDYLEVIKDYKQCADTAQEEDLFNETIQDAEDVIGLLEC